MPKIIGCIGFANDVEIRPGVHADDISERRYVFELLRNTARFQTGAQVNDDLTVANRISVIADSYIQDHIGIMRYVTFMGARWKISSIEVQYPRIILDLGGVYNGPTPDSAINS